MRCHLCDGWIEIHTDPENCTYVVVSGGQRKTETYEPTEDDRIFPTLGPPLKSPFYLLPVFFHSGQMSSS